MQNKLYYINIMINDIKIYLKYCIAESEILSQKIWLCHFSIICPDTGHAGDETNRVHNYYL